MNKGSVQRPSSHRAEWLAGAFWLGMAAVAYARLFIGVDFTDEAFYSALPHSFANGFRPYADELSLAQNAGILLTPADWLFERISGGATGLVLFNRHLFFAMVMGCAWLGARAGRAFAGAAGGRFTAAFVCMFSYFNIPAPSYNTLGALGLLAGVFGLLWRAAPGANRAPDRVLVGANLAFVSAAFAYPSLVGASAAGFAASAWCVWRERREGPKGGIRAWILSVVIGGVALGVFLGLTGIERLRAVLAYAASLGYASDGSVRETFVRACGQLKQLAWFWAVFGIWLAPLLVPRTWWRGRERWLPALAGFIGLWVVVVLARVPSISIFPAASTPVVLSLGLWFPLVVWRVRDRTIRHALLVIVGGPTLLAALAVAWSSTNGLWSAPIGLFTTATSVWLALWVIAREEGAVSDALGGGREAAIILLMAPLLGFLGYALLAKSYRDEVSPWGRADRVVAGGPYAGIVTVAAKARKVEALNEDLGGLAGGARTLLVLGDLPAGYLFSTFRPRTESTWWFGSQNQESNARRLNRLLTHPQGAPDFVLRAAGGWDGADSELERLGYEMHLWRDDFGYGILRKKKGAAGVGMSPAGGGGGGR